MSTARKRLGDLLVEAGVINQQQLLQALEAQKTTRLRLGNQLTKMGFVQEQQLIEVLEVQLGIPHVNLNYITVEPSTLKLVDGEAAMRQHILPLKKQGDMLTVAMEDPLDYYTIDDLRLSTGLQIQPVMVKSEELRLAIQRYYGMQQSIDQILKDTPDKLETTVGHDQSETSPVAQMVDQLIAQAVQLGASDIHIDAQELETRIRYRVDGVIRTDRTLPSSMHSILVTRIKVLAKLNIAEKRLPQDGRFQTEIDFHKLDLRVSILPTIFGEKVVIRLLDLSNVMIGMNKLGFSKQNLARFKQMIHAAYGIVLVTGPTGSGKTTTLYSALSALNSAEQNIITIEDPIEYQLAGVNQVQVNPTIGMTFAAGLRAILRQDPNIIMVGEIRDKETAEIAIRAAMTGHLVLSTLHTNDAVNSITRLVDMGVEPYLVASSLVGVVAQRLVRKVCSACAQPAQLTEKEEQLFKQRQLTTANIRKGTGCSVCSHTGYKGRIAVQEALIIDDQLRELMTGKQADVRYRQELQRHSHLSIFDDGLIKAAEGITTLEEVFRVSLENDEWRTHTWTSSNS